MSLSFFFELQLLFITTFWTALWKSLFSHFMPADVTNCVNIQRRPFVVHDLHVISSNNVQSQHDLLHSLGGAEYTLVAFIKDEVDCLVKSL